MLDKSEVAGGNSAHASTDPTGLDWPAIEALIQAEVAKQQGTAVADWQQHFELSLAKTQWDLRLEITDAEQKLMQMVEAARSEIDAYGEMQQAFMLELKTVSNTASESREATKVVQALIVGASEVEGESDNDVWQTLANHASKAARIIVADQGAKHTHQLQDLAEHSNKFAKTLEEMDTRSAELRACIEATDRRCSDALSNSVQRLESEMQAVQQEIKTKFDQSQTFSVSMLAPSLAEASQSEVVASELSTAAQTVPTSLMEVQHIALHEAFMLEGEAKIASRAASEIGSADCKCDSAHEQSPPRRTDMLRRTRGDSPDIPIVLTVQCLSEARNSRSHQNSDDSRACPEQDMNAVEDTTQEAEDSAAQGPSDARNFWSRQDKAACNMRPVLRDATYAADDAPLTMPQTLLEAPGCWSQQVRVHQQALAKEPSKAAKPASSAASSQQATIQAVSPTARPRWVPAAISVGPRQTLETRRSVAEHDLHVRPSVQTLRQRLERPTRRSEPAINPLSHLPTSRHRIASVEPGMDQGQPPAPGVRSTTGSTSGKCVGVALRWGHQQPSLAAASVGA